LRLVTLINGQERRSSTKNAKKREVEDRLSNPARWRGVPIGSYRDRMGVRDGENKLAHFRRQVLPIELLSDPSVMCHASTSCPSWFKLMSFPRSQRSLRLTQFVVAVTPEREFMKYPGWMG